MDLDVEFLRELCLCPAPSGFEGTVQAVLRRRLDGVAETHADPLGNLWADTGPEAGPHVVAVAHADQIGMIVTHVDEDGFLRIDAVGWLDQQLLPGHTVLVHGAGGPVRGVVGRPPTHIIPEAERGKAAPIKEQFVDIGAHDGAEALSRVAVGDPVTFDQDFHELAPGRFASLAIDDRAGVYAVVHGLELYAKAGGKAHLTAVSSAHEETTYMGAKAFGHRLHPDCVIVVDGDLHERLPGRRRGAHVRRSQARRRTGPRAGNGHQPQTDLACPGGGDRRRHRRADAGVRRQPADRCRGARRRRPGRIAGALVSRCATSTLRPRSPTPPTSRRRRSS